MTIPAFHHVPDRCWVSSSYYVRSSRVRLSISCCTKDTSIRQGCQLVFWGIESGCYGENNYTVTLSHFPILIRNSDTILCVLIIKENLFRRSPSLRRNMGRGVTLRAPVSLRRSSLGTGRTQGDAPTHIPRKSKKVSSIQ
jgi:hypothetical protein